MLDGKVTGRCVQQYRYQEFIRFLNSLEAAVPAGKLIHAVVDNYATTSIPRSVSGWCVTRAGRSTSPFPPLLGSMPSWASSQADKATAQG